MRLRMENKDEERRDLLKALEECDVNLDELKRVLAFLLIFQDDSPGLPNPLYLLEKYMRYIKEPAVKDEYLWGLHPLLMCRFENYCDKYDIALNNEGYKDE